MKQILLPIDFTDNAWNAAQCALSMYQGTEVHFFLICSQIPSSIDTSGNIRNAQSDEEFHQWKVKLDALLAPRQALHTLRATGVYIEDLRKAVNDNLIDLIILSSGAPMKSYEEYGARSIKDVITRIKCPVLLIPSTFKYRYFKNIALLSDFNFTHRAHATNRVLQFIHGHKPHLHMLQLSKTVQVLSQTQLDNKDFMTHALEKTPYSFKVVIDRYMGEALQSFITHNDIDVVILFAKNISLLEHILFTPLYQKEISYHQKMPFLIIHE